jgi:hypothetical protein
MVVVAVNKSWWTLNCHIAGYNLATLREKQKVQQWQLKTDQLEQSILRIKF